MEFIRQAMLMVSVILFFIGMIDCFLGYKVFRIMTVITVGIILGFMGAGIWAGLFNGKAVQIGFVLFAILGGYLGWKFYRVGVFFKGASVGFVMGLVLQMALGDINNFPFLAILLALVLGVIGAIYAKQAIIILTAISGASLMAVLPFVQSGSFFVYLIMFILFIAAGLYVQFALEAKDHGEKFEPNAFIDKFKNFDKEKFVENSKKTFDVVKKKSIEAGGKTKEASIKAYAWSKEKYEGLNIDKKYIKYAAISFITVIVLFFGYLFWDKNLNFKTIDPFVHINLGYEGFDGEAVAYYENTIVNTGNLKLDQFLNETGYEMSKARDLSSGEEIEVVVRTTDEILKENKFKLSSTSKTFTVPKLKKYVTAKEDITKLTTFDTLEERKNVELQKQPGLYSSRGYREFMGYYYVPENAFGYSPSYNALAAVVAEQERDSEGNDYQYVYLYYVQRLYYDENDTLQASDTYVRSQYFYFYEDTTMDELQEFLKEKNITKLSE